MTTRGPELNGRSRALQTVHLVLAALAALIIAVASQGWPSATERCDTGSVCDGL